MNTVKALLVAGFAGLIGTSAHAAITLEYDNDTGAYAVSGTDSGPGGSFNSAINFDWDWGTDSTFTNAVQVILTGVVADDGIAGTVDGDAFVADNVIYDSSESIFIGFSFSTPLQTGALTLNSTSGNIGSGLFGLGDGTYTGIRSYAGENMSLVVGTVVPEPSTWAMIVGGLALGVAVWRRKQTTA